MSKKKNKNNKNISYKNNRPKSNNGLSSKKPNNGKIGEMATIKKLLEHEIPVYVPVVDTGVDLIAEFGGKFQRIQVKSSTRSNSSFTYFELVHNKNIIKNNTVKTEHIGYSSEDIDYFSLYDINNDEVYLLENDESRKSFNIRYEKPKNSQIAKINNAEDYQIDNVLNMIKMGINQSDIIDAAYEILNDSEDDT